MKNLLSLPRRHFTTIGAASILAACTKHTIVSRSLQFHYDSSTPLQQTSFDAYPHQVQAAIEAHYSISIRSLTRLPLHSMIAQLPWSEYSNAAFIAPLTQDFQRWCSLLNLPTHLDQYHATISALLAQTHQWDHPYDPTTTAPITPSVLPSRGLFIDKNISISSSLLTQWKKWYNQGYFSTDFSDSSSQAHINEWLTINSGSRVIKHNVPSHPHVLLWDIWLIASSWKMSTSHHPQFPFYTPHGPRNDCEYFSFHGPTAQYHDHVVQSFSFPLGNRLALNIFLPAQHAQWNRAEKTQFSRTLPQWLHQLSNHLLELHARSARSGHGKTQPLPYQPGTITHVNIPTWETSPRPLESSLLNTPLELPQLDNTSHAILNSQTNTCALTVSPAGIGPQEYSSSLPRYHVSDSYTCDVPFVYQIVDSVSGIIFLQGLMHNLYEEK